VNLGPVAPTLAETDVVATGPGSAYNPRCIKRDISAWVSSQWNTDASSTTLLTQNPDIYWFQTVMQGDFASGFYGVHTGGHFTFGGDPGGDIFTSPGDPVYVEPSIYPNQRMLTKDFQILAPSRTNRPHLVDLAEPRYQEPTERYFGNDHSEQQPAEPKWYFG
jgi:hypothetical protein